MKVGVSVNQVSVVEDSPDMSESQEPDKEDPHDLREEWISESKKVPLSIEGMLVPSK